MNSELFFSIINNALLLLVLGTLYTLLPVAPTAQRLSARVATGCVIGLIGVALMSNPWVLQDGVVFDVRTILLAVAGLYFGFVPTLVAVFMTAIYRISDGGAGMWSGLATIASAAALGLWFRWKIARDPHRVKWHELYWLGLAVHVVMLLCMLIMPWTLAWEVLRQISLPVLLIYPPATMLLAMLLARQLEGRQIANSLAESEARYRSIFENNHAVILLIDADNGAISDANPAASRFYGWSREQLTGMRIHDINCQSIDEIAAEMARARNEARNHFYFQHRLANGEVRDVEVYSGPIALQGRSLLFSVIHDITERRKAEEALHHSEEKYRQLAEGTDAILWEYDIASDRWTYVSPQVERILGYAPGEWRDLQFWTDHLHPDDRGWAAQYCAECTARGEAHRFEYRFHSRDGGYVWIRDVVSVEMGDDAPVRLRGFMIDITERKLAEEALRQHQALLNETGRIAHVGGWILDMDTRQLTWSDEVYHIYEVDTDYQPSVDNGIEFFAPEARDVITEAVRGALEDGEPFDLELPFNTARGNARWVHAVGKADVTAHKIYGTIQDITERRHIEEERRRLEEQIEQSQRLESLGVLAGGIAHDFNNILMVILGCAELAQRQLPASAPACESLAQINTAAHRATDLCRQMLAYAGKSTITMERVHLGELVEEMGHLLKSSVSKKALLNVHVAHHLPGVHADKSQLRQVIMNLIINASDAIGERSGVISVSVGATRCDDEYLRSTELHAELPPGLYLHLEVADTGCGMDAETRARMFEPFFSTKFPGRGLGLAAVLGIVRSHHGALKVYSEPGKGTTMKILLPALDEEIAGATRENAPIAEPWQGNGVILFADDEESVRAIGARMMEYIGFSVVTASDGLQALDYYRDHAHEIDLVVLDMTMPHMDGAEAFSEMRRINPRACILLASGYSKEDISSRFSGKGLAGVLEKPFTLDTLRDCLRSATTAMTSTDVSGD